MQPKRFPIPVSRWGAGIVMAVAATGLAFSVHALLPPIPAMTAAVALGLLAANIPGTATWAAGRARPGLDFAGKHHMRAGIVLLGLKVSVVDVLNLGWFALVLIAAVVLLSFAGTYGLARLVKLPRDGALLIATGFSICGASAIGAMAAVRRIKHQDTVLPVAPGGRAFRGLAGPWRPGRRGRAPGHPARLGLVRAGFRGPRPHPVAHWRPCRAGSA